MVTLNVGSAETRNKNGVNLDVRRDAFTGHRREGHCIVADATTLPFRPNTFNYIYASNVMEHMPTHPYDVLNEWAYVCTLGGIIHVVCPTGNLKIILNEALVVPFITASFIRKKRFKTAWGIIGHFLKVRRRLQENYDTGFGGHRWYCPWGWRIYYRDFFPFKLRGWEGLHVMFEAFYVKNAVSKNAEEYTLYLAKREELNPPPDKHVSYTWA
jgi:SAM-dependent methyltransferase